MAKSCDACAGLCCRYFCFEIDKPETYEDFENIRWYLCHQDVSVHIDEGDWYIAILNPCKMLVKGRCGDYDNRPIICRTYGHKADDNCEMTEGSYDYDAEFKTPEDLLAYARKKLGERKFEQAQKQLRGKYEPKPPRPKKKSARKTVRSAGRRA